MCDVSSVRAAGLSHCVARDIADEFCKGRRKEDVRLLYAACLIVLSTGMAVAGGYNSFGFEAPTFALGPLNGQDGWNAGASAGGVEPWVVVWPDPAYEKQAIRLAVSGTQGSSSWMEHAIPEVTVNNLTIVTVSYDIFRLNPDTDQNLWWWWWDAGEPTYGLQWDLNGTFPHGWNPGAGSTATVFGAYANLKMVWDFTTNKAYSWYNGVLVDNGIPISNITKLTGWTIALSHDAASGAVGDVAWIDNFVIDVQVIPEPGSILALATGLIGFFGLARRRS